jgi:sugar phosphate isomerase/epimerase
MGKRAGITIILSVFIMNMCCGAKEQADNVKCENWRLGVQAWSFNRFTFYEAVDKTASLGLKWMEAYPHGQKLSKDKPNIIFGHNMPPEAKQEVKQKLKDAGIKLVNYGVANLPNNEAECRKVFDFAREMGIETIVSEPPEDAFDLIDRLCQEYQISVAIHNHANPTPYWDPNTVLKVCKGRSKWLGACPDTGHWVRSGINPVEALKKLEGRVLAVHLKDMNEFGSLDAHCVPWGTGKADIKAILTEFHRQNFKGVFSIEYEYNWENSLPQMQQCVEYFNKVVSELKSK